MLAADPLDRVGPYSSANSKPYATMVTAVMTVVMCGGGGGNFREGHGRKWHAGAGKPRKVGGRVLRQEGPREGSATFFIPSALPRGESRGNLLPPCWPFEPLAVDGITKRWNPSVWANQVRF